MLCSILLIIKYLQDIIEPEYNKTRLCYCGNTFPCYNTSYQCYPVANLATLLVRTKKRSDKSLDTDLTYLAASGRAVASLCLTSKIVC